ncbi:hypothetical protein H4R20_002123 [Coemansia guatemalensis]|uniref:Uncharacterized protein n=1 Tax=Coemansia guatemalensis TaxID=2761395 RepID=A0A9W8HY81_9FUNG|nr:hypothetical protein H4R20_002123 [Coemansia guatemalensis]
MSPNDGPTSTRHSSSDTTNSSKGNGSSELTSEKEVSPTWDELKRTRTPMQLARQKQQQTNSNGSETHGHKFCVTDMMYKSSEDLVSGRVQKPIIGHMSCMEYMTEQMSQTVLHARKQQQQNEGELWAEKWYGQWTLRWQMVTLLGQQNINRYLNMNGATQEVADGLFAGDKELQRRYLRIVPMDQVLDAWQTAALAYPEKVVQPAVRSVTRYKESWTDGSQAKWAGWYRDSALNFGAAKMASRIGNAVANFWNSIDENNDK